MVIASAPERNKLHASVVAAFEEQILSGGLKVGDRLPSEGEIARQFNISTRSVREAMQVLETKGLVRRKHGERAEEVRDDVGQFLGSLATTVRRLFSREPDYLVDLMDVRRMFEVEAAGRLAAGEGRLDGALEEALEKMRASLEARSFPDYAEADAAFHLAMVQALGNEILSTVYENLYGLITDVIRLSVRVPSKSLQEGLEEHEALYRALRSGDPERAKAAITGHIENSTSYLREALTRAHEKEEQ
jgi:GntR family transcriptional regulator, transcriptional repressor for pyruvate dehydrogenase complex